MSKKKKTLNYIRSRANLNRKSNFSLASDKLVFFFLLSTPVIVQNKRAECQESTNAVLVMNLRNSEASPRIAEHNFYRVTIITAGRR